MKNTATEYYKSRQGNCAQSIAVAWAVKSSEDLIIKEQFVQYGSGKAPEGMCGALYAACSLAGDNYEVVKDEFATFSAGHISCKDIRKAKQLPCIKCVEVAAKLLEKHSGE